jgi:hypothetical protein
MSEILAQTPDLAPGFILDYDSIAGRTGIAPSAAIAVSDKIVSRRIFSRLEEVF